MTRPDDGIKQDVEEKLRRDADLDPTNIAMAVSNGIAALTGFVRSYTQKHEAEAAAKRVADIVGLANELNARLPGANQRPDRPVVTEIRSWLPVGSEKIHVVVRNGWVTLDGEVEWNVQREEPERAVPQIPGLAGSATWST